MPRIPPDIGRNGGEITDITPQRVVRADDIVLDSISDAFIEQSTNGVSVRRVAIVSGISGSSATVLGNALLAPGIPRFGDSHPIYNTTVQSVRAEPASNQSPDTVKVIIDYGFPQPSGDDFGIIVDEVAPPTIEVISTVQSVTTNKDVDNKLITVSKTTTDAQGNPTTDTQGGTVSFQAPMTTVRFRRKEPFSPGNKSVLYTGKINSGPIDGFAPHTWLCTNLSGISNDGGNTYNVTYEFQHNIDTWDAVIVWTDPKTGLPDPAVDANGNITSGVAVVQIYREIDFSPLQLPF